MNRCDRPDCGRGVIDEQGFCTDCDRRPLGLPAGASRLPAPDGGRPAAGPRQAPQGASVGVANVRPDPWWVLELVEADLAPELPDEPPPDAGPVAEEHRFCANTACGEPVGRGHDGEPGRISGFCANCGDPFDFGRSHADQVIAGRYEVERVLGSGSYGAAYLAHDRNLDTRVVLKALRNRSVAETARTERDALVGLRHDSIVRILSYENEGPHLVLEYIPGTPLSARPGDRLEVLLAHGLRILQALDYLHAKGLLHCDVKPSNIIRFREESTAGARDRVRLIDFGSLRTRDDIRPLVAYTKAYAPPDDAAGRPDPEHLRPTAGFDLFCLGMTLAEVCSRHLRDRTAPGVDSLHLLLDRATDVTAPERRFVSARQFAEQVGGVIRQIVAAPPTGLRVSRASGLFGSVTESLHGGLGAARPFGHWAAAGLTADGLLTLSAPFASPLPEDIAVALPAPLADPEEPVVAERAASGLAACRLALRHGDTDLARLALDDAPLPAGHWLRSWYRGLIALARGDCEAATGQFMAVRRTLPGELVPQFALGLCAELGGDLQVAQSHYDTVFDTAPALGAAGFGLARVHLLAGRRAAAVATAERLAQEFRYEREARIAGVRLRVSVIAGPDLAAPTADDLARARAAVDELDLDGAAAAGLIAEIRYAECVLAHDRRELSEVVREVARYAPTERDHTTVVDLANRLRPALTWRWPGRSGRAGTSRSPERSGALNS
ncbi:tetratricopeptide repeat protein [Streptomyces sp. V4-01]|uniref:non-specific serine/threonine protein kinase n=1 Tax=Actinacidiphila polyblastidii TaxID=3110430 RepID=A0ABU7PGX8_9ACTN|nr:tetratricopeptide repeat protein [Streptomyces sp. V4-01]